MSHSLEKQVLTVNQLLQLSGLTIPSYQRPYQWSARNIQQLFQDIERQKQKSAYRLGTLVFQCDEKSQDDLNIVDGQQRTLTLVLMVWAIIRERKNRLERLDLKNKLESLEKPLEIFMENQTFASEISKHNLHQNYLEVRRLICRNEFTEYHIDFLLNRCEVVTFTLNDISEAFQFFDSQNARGRDLEPHDLLKAYHLREFSDLENDLKASTVESWEALESEELAALFAKYLYRIRHWVLGHSARYFGKNDVALFKGVNLDKIDHYPYVESLRISHYYVDNYNHQYQRKVDGQHQVFPFHLDQMIINGRRFFEMAAHYQQQVVSVIGAEKNPTTDFLGAKLSAQATVILDQLNSYPARTRTGDKYVRGIFDCGLIFYIDKFGEAELSLAIEKIFIWAYSVRIKQQVVQLATIDNYVLSHNLFRMIKDATLPSDVLTMSLATLSNSVNKNNTRKNSYASDPLVILFKEMNYYE